MGCCESKPEEPQIETKQLIGDQQKIIQNQNTFQQQIQPVHQKVESEKLQPVRAQQSVFQPNYEQMTPKSQSKYQPQFVQQIEGRNNQSVFNPNQPAFPQVNQPSGQRFTVMDVNQVEKQIYQPPRQSYMN